MKLTHIILLTVISGVALHASAIVAVGGYQVQAANSEPGNTPNGPTYIDSNGGPTSATGPLNFSLSSSDGYSSGYLNATAQFGLLQVSTTASANSPDNPPVENYANAVGGVYFEDALTLSDPGAPEGTQISLLVTDHLNDSISDAGDPTSEFCPSTDPVGILVELSGGGGTILDSDCGYQATRTLSQAVTVATNANGIATYDPSLTLSVDDHAQTYGGDTEYGAHSSSDISSVTASGYLTVEVETAGVTMTSASGTDYSVIQTADAPASSAAPEPSTYALLGAGFVGLGLIRRRR